MVCVVFEMIFACRCLGRSVCVRACVHVMVKCAVRHWLYCEFTQRSVDGLSFFRF